MFMINRQLEKLRTTDVGDWVLDVPNNAVLKFSDVLALKAGRRRFLYVIEPQLYERVTKLTAKDYMVTDDLDQGARATCGLFSNSHGCAVSGSGDDLWLVPTPALLKYLRKLSA